MAEISGEIDAGTDPGRLQFFKRKKLSGGAGPDEEPVHVVTNARVALEPLPGSTDRR